MESAIKNILKNTYVDGIFHTHVSLIRPRGKFLFDRQTIEDFWNLYCKLIYEDENAVIGIAEKPRDYLPILVDVDLRVRDEGDISDNKLYTTEQLKEVVQVYQSILRQILDNCNDRDLTCVVLEKKMYSQIKNEITYLKHGFHLHFPYCFVSKVNQEVHLIPRVKESLKNLKTFENLGFEDSGDVIDKACCNVPWLLYGSRKSEDSQPYKVTTVYNSALESISLEKAFKHFELFDHREQLINIRGKVHFYLPRILSTLDNGKTPKELKKNIISPLKEKLKKKERKSSTNHRRLNATESLQIAKQLLPMLSQFRAEDRNEWMSIGWLLFNVTDGHPDALDLWCEFSARCEDKYDENECIFQWERMTPKDLTLGTLRYYASIDNPVEYKKYKAKEAKKHIVNSLEGSHNDIAKALHEEFGDEFVCASITNKVWFQFINHRWEQIEEGVFLREKISGQRMLNKYTNAAKELYDQLRDCEDKSRQVMIQTRIKMINKMITNLKASPYKSNVMKECCEVFYDPVFRDKLDANPNIIGFLNGVYDLTLNNFRPGRPEDYLSKSLGINYREFDEDDPAVENVFTFLEQVFPDKSIRRYFLDIYCDIFQGGNHEKIVVFWTGDGDNAKSVTQKFFEIMLGKLAIKLNTNVITGKKPSAGSAFADLARAGGGVRWAILEEPDSDEVINCGILKYLSGNDSFYARDLFERGKDGREIKPLFKLSFVCNKLPRMKNPDKAVWNRCRVLPFEATFCRQDDPAPEKYEEQLKQKRFPMDKHFAKKIPKMVEAFAWILLQHRQKRTHIVEPDKVREATRMYQKQNDIYRQFIDEDLTEDPKSILSLAELYNMFKEWYRNSLPGQNVPVKNEVEEYFIRMWGHPKKGKKWSGYRKRGLEDDLQTGDAVILDDDDLVEYSDAENESNLPPM